MATITVTYRNGLAETIGTREEHIEAQTISDVLGHVKSTYGKQVSKTARSMLITVNGVSILKIKVFATRLNDGDVVGFFPLALGG